MNIREKKHRLPNEYYRGQVSAAFTLCLNRKVATGSMWPGDISLLNSEIVAAFTDILASEIGKFHCIVPVYCFMPDHQHLIITGTRDDADLLKAVVSYKQRTGFWLSKHKPSLNWQKDFYDHIIRKQEDLAAQVRYVLDNPVRKGLVASWQEYPHKGSIGCDLNNVLNGIMMS